ncbi:hypothetical protein KIL84_013092 [Mauremys mutica]|uniref:Uncharacterized protein n=1 Tax=Mauremys mutica TaxID=74926 RepID=A0A9D3XTD0_9SAUR|nr:hypothetical protein KIL84_013092 [Mauremys mutica]
MLTKGQMFWVTFSSVCAMSKLCNASLHHVPREFTKSSVLSSPRRPMSSWEKGIFLNRTGSTNFLQGLGPQTYVMQQVASPGKFTPISTEVHLAEKTSPITPAFPSPGQK